MMLAHTRTARGSAAVARGARRASLIVLAVVLVLPAFGCSSPPATLPTAAPPTGGGEVREVVAPQGYRLVFADEFEGDELDGDKWHRELTWGTKPESELEQYSPDALAVKDGFLTITASKTPGAERPYGSGVIASYGHYDFTYGYVEMRAKMPPGRGMWPAFWMLCRNEDLHREIDVTEVLGRLPTRSYMTFHYRVGEVPKNFHYWAEGPDLTEDFHTYAVKWTPGLIEWYLDGVKKYEVKHSYVPSDPMYLIANLAVGGRWAGAPDEDTRFPAEMTIDYIRVFQQEQDR